MDLTEQFVDIFKVYIICLFEQNVSKEKFSEFTKIFNGISGLKLYIDPSRGRDGYESIFVLNIKFNFKNDFALSYITDYGLMKALTISFGKDEVSIITNKKLVCSDYHKINKRFINCLFLIHLNLKDILMFPLFFTENELDSHADRYNNHLFNLGIHYDQNTLNTWCITGPDNFLENQLYNDNELAGKLKKKCLEMSIEKLNNDNKINEFYQQKFNTDVENFIINEENKIYDILVSLYHENDFYMHYNETDDNKYNPKFVKSLYDKLDEFFPNLKYLKGEDFIRFMTYLIQDFRHDKLVEERIKAIYALNNRISPEIQRYLVMNYI